MLQVEKGAHRRLVLILSVIGLMLGSVMVSGLVQRFAAQYNSPTERLDATQLDDIRREAEALRATRNKLASLGKTGEWKTAAEVAAQAYKDRERLMMRALLAEALFHAGDIAGARKEFAGFLAQAALNDSVSQADRLAWSGDTAGYRRLCQSLLDRVSPDTALPLEANNVAWTSVTLAEGIPDYTKSVALARQAVSQAVEAQDRWVYLNTLGVALYRAGEYQEALERLQDAEAIQSDAFNWPFIALSHYRLGEVKKAMEWKGRFYQELIKTYASPHLQNNRHELLLFLMELNQSLPQP